MTLITNAKSGLISAAFLSAALVVSAVLSEVALRLFTPFPINVEIANTVPDLILGHVMDTRFPDIDENGFRNERVLEQADIVVIGDSQTYGFNVGIRDSWPNQLAQLTGKTVYNYGIGWYSFLQYLFLFDKALELSPDAIVITLSLQSDLREICPYVRNLVYWRRWLDERGIDISPCGISVNSQQVKNTQETKSLTMLTKIKIQLKKTAILSIFDYYIYDPIKYKFALDPKNEAVRLSDDKNNTVFHYNRLKKMLTATDNRDPEVQIGWRVMEMAFRDFAKVAKWHDVKLYVLFAPSKESVFVDYLQERRVRLPADMTEAVRREAMWESKVEGLLEELGVPWVNPFPLLKALLDEEGGVYSFREDSHPLEPGYAAYARAANEAFFKE